MLDTVRVQTAGTGHGEAEIVVRGLVNSQYFRQCVRALRRGDALPEPPSARAAKLFSPESKKAKDESNALAEKQEQHVLENEVAAAPAPLSKKASKAIAKREKAQAEASQETVSLLRDIKDDLKAIRLALEKK